MARSATGRRVTKATDAFWLTIGAVALGSGVFGVVRAITSGSYKSLNAGEIVIWAAAALATYWVVAGAWRRTSWGQRKFEEKKDDFGVSA